MLALNRDLLCSVILLLGSSWDLDWLVLGLGLTVSLGNLASSHWCHLVGTACTDFDCVEGDRTAVLSNEVGLAVAVEGDA